MLLQNIGRWNGKKLTLYVIEDSTLQYRRRTCIVPNDASYSNSYCHGYKSETKICDFKCRGMRLIDGFASGACRCVSKEIKYIKTSEAVCRTIINSTGMCFQKHDSNGQESAKGSERLWQAIRPRLQSPRESLYRLLPKKKTAKQVRRTINFKIIFFFLI